MKNIFKIATLTTALTFASVAKANDNIGFADADYLFQNHPLILAEEAKIAKFMQENQQKFAEEDKKLRAEGEKLQADAKKLEQEMKSVEASLKKKVAALEKEAPRLRSKDIQSRQQAIESEQKAFQNKVVAFQKREDEFKKKIAAFQAKIEKASKATNGASPEEIQKKAVDQINETIKEVAKAKGYTLIMPPSLLLYAADESKDATNEILAILKSKNPDVVLPEPAKAEAPKADAPKAEEAKPEAPKTEEAKPAEAKQ